MDAQARWDALPLRQQYAAAYRLARLLEKRGVQALGAGVVGIGVGPRRRRSRSGTDRRFFDSPCLVVHVEHKLTLKQLAKSRTRKALPRFIKYRMQHSKHRRVGRVAVPVDVVQHRGVPRAQAAGLAMSHPRPAGAVRANGSLAARVRNMRPDGSDDGNRYLLTCHHVACMSLNQPDLAPLLPAFASAIPQGGRVGEGTRPAYFGPNLDRCIDAALVRLNPQSANHVFPPASMAGYARDISELAMEARTGCWLYSLHNPGGTGARYLGHQVNSSVQYGGGAVTRIIELVEYQLDGKVSRAGDSGGALVSGNGLFLAMHIAGIDDLGYAIPAFHLLGAPAFSPRIRLA